MGGRLAAEKTPARRRLLGVSIASGRGSRGLLGGQRPMSFSATGPSLGMASVRCAEVGHADALHDCTWGVRLVRLHCVCLDRDG